MASCRKQPLTYLHWYHKGDEMYHAVDSKQLTLSEATTSLSLIVMRLWAAAGMPTPC